MFVNKDSKGVYIMRERRYAAEKRRRAVRRQKRMILLAFLCLIIVTVSLCFSFRVNADSAEQARSYKYYTDVVIEPGESLWDIALAHMSEEYDSPKEYIKEVKEINQLLDADEIYGGQRIVIPYYDSEFKY